MMMNHSEKVVIITRQDKVSSFKLKRFFEAIDCSNQSKFLFVCNMYDEKKKNYIDENQNSGYAVSMNHVHLFEDETMVDNEEQISDIKKLVHMIL